jgi:succinate dehydrogenase/fumarate reductase flavoprotein subunit
MELTRRHAGPKYLVRCGQGTWVGVLKDLSGKPIGPFLEKPERKYGDPTTELYKGVFEDFMRSGRGPVYMDCTGISDEDYEYMIHWLRNEGNSFLVDHMKKMGIDLRKNPVEFMSYELRTNGWICTDEQTRTSMPGLYAAGDESFNEISPAAVFGWIAGENAAQFAGTATSADAAKIDAQMDEKIDFINEVRGRETGPDWKEVNVALQQLMFDYVGPVRSEALLTTGRGHLKRLRENARNLIISRNQHELALCLEVFDLLEVGELVFVAADARKETRGLHVRSDYPFTNPLLDKSLIVKRVDGKPVTEWRAK